jgi:hypothetical protein
MRCSAYLDRATSFVKVRSVRRRPGLDLCSDTAWCQGTSRFWSTSDCNREVQTCVTVTYASYVAMERTDHPTHPPACQMAFIFTDHL